MSKFKKGDKVMNAYTSECGVIEGVYEGKYGTSYDVHFDNNECAMVVEDELVRINLDYPLKESLELLGKLLNNLGLEIQPDCERKNNDDGEEYWTPYIRIWKGSKYAKYPLDSVITADNVINFKEE